MVDALNQEILIGKTYCYITNNNGETTSIYGKCIGIKEDKDRVIIEIIKKYTRYRDIKSVENPPKTSSISPKNIVATLIESDLKLKNIIDKI